MGSTNLSFGKWTQIFRSEKLPRHCWTGWPASYIPLRWTMRATSSSRIVRPPSCYLTTVFCPQTLVYLELSLMLNT